MPREHAGASGGNVMTDAEACETDGLLLCGICAGEHGECEVDALAADMLP